MIIYIVIPVNWKNHIKRYSNICRYCKVNVRFSIHGHDL